MSPDEAHNLRGCWCCGLVQQVGQVRAGFEARCRRCQSLLVRHGGLDRSQLCLALVLASLICYPAGITLPVMRLQQMGHVHEASIWTGGISLLTHGQVAVGLVVLLCSVVIPLAKLLGLLMLLSRWRLGVAGGPRQRARLYRGVELAGRWGMIDVLLVAVLVAALKLGDLVQVTPGPGLTAFAACVVLSLLAAACLDPHAIWSES
jgi:paraquat-inducible protein A